MKKVVDVFLFIGSIGITIFNSIWKILCPKTIPSFVGHVDLVPNPCINQNRPENICMTAHEILSFATSVIISIIPARHKVMSNAISFFRVFLESFQIWCNF